MPDFPFGEAVVVHNPVIGSPEDSRGNQTITWDAGTIETWALWERGASAEDTTAQRSDTVVNELEGMPQGVTVATAQSKVTARGGDWDVIGDPAGYNSPLTGTGITTVVLRKATG